jgi:ribonuclease P protein component
MKHGKALKGSLLSLKYKEGSGKKPKFAVVVSKKVSNSAVKRNKVKRRVREVVRVLVKDGRVKGLSCVVITNRDILDKSVDEILEDLSAVLNRVVA